MSDNWRPIDNATPKDGTILRLWCPGVGPNPKPFECDGRFAREAGAWLGVENDRTTGLVEPRKWKPLP